MGEVRQLFSNPNQLQGDSQPQRRVWPYLLAAIGVCGGVAAWAGDSKTPTPEFIIEGHNLALDPAADLVAGVNLRCNERGVLDAVVLAEARVVTTRLEDTSLPASNGRAGARGRIVKFSIETDLDGCPEALDLVRSDPSGVIEGVLGNVQGSTPEVWGDGSPRMADDFEATFEQARADGVRIIEITE